MDVDLPYLMAPKRLPELLEKMQSQMMGEAMAEELEDEEAFMAHMQGGIASQAQAVLDAGTI